MWSRTGKVVRPLTSDLRELSVVERGLGLVFIQGGIGGLGCRDSSKLRAEAVARHYCLLRDVLKAIL